MVDPRTDPTDRFDERLPIDPLTDEGAAELRRRIGAAEVELVPRAELDGHVGLSSRALYELGVTIAPVGVRGVPAAVLGRLQVVAGVLVGGAFLGLAASAVLEGVFGLIGVLENDSRDEVATGAAVGAVMALVGWPFVLIARDGVRRVRAGRAKRRLVVGAGTDPADDPEARGTVAVVREPRGLRVSLLWLRGDAQDPERVELRSVLEEHVPADDPIRAEDTVELLSEVALRADAMRGLTAARDETDASYDVDGIGGRPATTVGRPGRTRGTALVAAAGTELPSVDPRKPVPDGWDPEALTDEGRADLAARLVRARPLLWNAAELERLAVDPRAPDAHRPGPWPTDTARLADLASPMRKSTRRWTLTAAWTAATIAVLCGAAADDAGPETADDNRLAALVFLVIAWGLFAGLRAVRRRAPGRRLLHVVRAAARTPSAALERGVPGGAGRVLVLHGFDPDGSVDRKGAPTGPDRVELVHVRPAPGGDARQRLQVRTLARWEHQGDAPLTAKEVARDLGRIADDAGFVTTRSGADASGVERLNRALGRATDGSSRPRSRLEPLAWAGWAFWAVGGILWLGFALSEDRLDKGGAIALGLLTWPWVTAWIFDRSARRVLDPVD